MRPPLTPLLLRHKCASRWRTEHRCEFNCWLHETTFMCVIIIIIIILIIIIIIIIIIITTTITIMLSSS